MNDWKQNIIPVLDRFIRKGKKRYLENLLLGRVEVGTILWKPPKQNAASILPVWAKAEEFPCTLLRDINPALTIDPSLPGRQTDVRPPIRMFRKELLVRVNNP